MSLPNQYITAVPTASAAVTGVLTAGDYNLQIVVTDKSGNVTTANHTLSVADGLAVSGLMSGPNPFNPDKQSATLQYQLSQNADVRLYIYSISGERQWETAISAGDINGGSIGFNRLNWDGRNQWGETVASGVYVCYLIATNGSDKNTMLII